jgi:NADH-quinone oxidoreductase subunit A
MGSFTALAGVAVAFGVLLALAGVAGIAARAISPVTQRVEVLPFQSGFAPQEHALSRFHARWYPLTVVFLAFDVEMLFMYPWAVVAATIGAEAIVEMFVFLAVLVLAVVWAAREGALRWV